MCIGKTNMVSKELFKSQQLNEVFKVNNYPISSLFNEKIKANLYTISGYINDKSTEQGAFNWSEHLY